MNLMLLLAATVWMAPNGNDATGDGSKGKPVATLKRAVEITRGILTDEDKRIVVKDGVYRFAERFVFLGGDAGLTVEAEHSRKAIFTGARAVTGWKTDPKDGRFLVADFPFKPQDGWTYSFVVNGKTTSFACYPEDLGRKTLPYIAGNADIPKNNRRVLTYDRRSLPSMDALKDLDLTSARIFVPQEWASVRAAVATNDWKHGRLVLAKNTDMPIGQFNQGYKVYNARIGMTAPGTWMYSIGEAKIWYWPREGETAATLKAEVSEIHQIVWAPHSRDLTFRGLVFEGCSRSEKMDESNGSALRGCRGVTLEDCEFRHLAGSGFTTYHDDDLTIRKCYAHDLDRCGFWVYAGGNILIEDNEACRSAEGISFYSGVKAIGNHVHHTRCGGFGAWSCDCLIASNEIDHTMMVTRDGGGLYGAQVRCEFVGNYCHDNGDWPGLYNDEGGQYSVYRDNVWEETYWPFHMHDCYALTLTNNTFIGKNGMLFSFQGSTHCVFKDNVIRTAMPIANPPELVNCDVWDNEVQMMQPDGSVVTNRLAFPKKLEPPAAPAQACLMSESPVDAKTGKWTGKGFRGGRGVSLNRNADGVNIPGVPGGGAGFGFYGEYLYVYGSYEYNKVCGYDGCFNNAGHVWGVNDGVRFQFADFSVDVFFDKKGKNREECGTFVVSDGSFECDSTNCAGWVKHTSGAGGRGYRFRVPLKRLGIDPAKALGAKIPMNVIFFNADHREYKYFATPAKNGFWASLFGDDYDYLTGTLELVPYVRDNYGFVNLQQGTVGRADRMPSGMLRDANQCVGINTVAREGDDFRRDGKCGYDTLDEYVRGFMIRHREAKGKPWHQDFLLLPFRDDDPSDDGVFTRHADKASEYCESGRGPGYYFIKFEDWQLGTGHTASTNCVYSWYQHSKGGVMKICLDTQDGPDGVVTLSEGELKDGVFEGHNRVKGADGKTRDVYVKLAFDVKPVAVRELKPNGKQGRRYILDFLIKPKQQILVKAAVSSKSLDEARVKFAADDPAKGFYDWSGAAQADWREYFKAIPHEDGDHGAFYTDRYFDEVK